MVEVLWQMTDVDDGGTLSFSQGHGDRVLVL